MTTTPGDKDPAPGTKTRGVAHKLREIAARVRRAATRRRKRCKTINLALQGGGAHGAFTWGVLDALLEDERLDFEAISGTSAGAMNAVVLADGLMRDGAEGARHRLGAFWRRVSQEGAGIGAAGEILQIDAGLLAHAELLAVRLLRAVRRPRLALPDQPAQHQSAARPRRPPDRLRPRARQRRAQAVHLGDQRPRPARSRSSPATR